MITSLDNYTKNHLGQRALLTDCRFSSMKLEETEFSKADRSKNGFVSVTLANGQSVLAPEDHLCFIIEPGEVAVS